MRSAGSGWPLLPFASLPRLVRSSADARPHLCACVRPPLPRPIRYLPIGGLKEFVNESVKLAYGDACPDPATVAAVQVRAARRASYARLCFRTRAPVVCHTAQGRAALALPSCVCHRAAPRPSGQAAIPAGMRPAPACARAADLHTPDSRSPRPALPYAPSPSPARGAAA